MLPSLCSGVGSLVGILLSAEKQNKHQTDFDDHADSVHVDEDENEYAVSWHKNPSK